MRGSTNGRSNGSANGKTAVVPVVLVQIQTLKGSQGTAAAMAEVQTAVTTYNKTAPKTAQHVVAGFAPLPNNVKGMQWQLALLATLARAKGVNMIRLGVHNGNVALCGPKDAVAAVVATMPTAVSAYGTMVATTYSPSVHGNRVGFTNAYLCGAPAGLQAALNIVPALAYGIGYLFTFQAPSNAVAYAIGQAAGKAAGKTTIETPNAPKTKTTTTRAPKTKTTTVAAVPATTADATTADATTDAAIVAA